MQSLQTKAEDLKKEQVQLKMAINEKNTANILCCLFAKDKTDRAVAEDPRIEALLRRPTDAIPDASKLPALQPLILPSGAQHSKKNKTSDAASKPDFPDDGIDYELLGKDRSKCTPAELDQIRRERNRMHAKRTRDRKRLFMEEMADLCKTLETENMMLQRHLNGLNGVLPQNSHTTHQPCSSAAISPSLPPASPPLGCSQEPYTAGMKRSLDSRETSSLPASKNGVTYDQINTLLEAAGAAAEYASSKNPYSSGSSTSESEGDSSDYKRRRLSASSDDVSAAVPKSISTTIAASSMTTSIGV